MKTQQFDITTFEQLEAAAKEISKQLRPGAVICLYGEMGAGKTTFTGKLAAQFGIKRTNSPTFALVNIYDEGTLPMYHLDLYRLMSEEDLMSFDIDRYLEQTDGVTVIEWPEKLGQFLPQQFFKIELTLEANSQKRQLSVSQIHP